jgi:hypothetical protein
MVDIKTHNLKSKTNKTLGGGSLSVQGNSTITPAGLCLFILTLAALASHLSAAG